MTSQLLAIYFLNDLDHYIKEKLYCKYYVRYMDDFIIFDPDKEHLKELKKNKDFHTKTVALTANAISGMREKYLSVGFDDYLAKPIKKEELEVILDKYLREDKK